MAVRSALAKPVTVSEKVIVTVDVSPTLRAVSLSVIVAVGGVVSTTIALFPASELAEPVAGRTRPAEIPPLVMAPPFSVREVVSL